MLLNNRLSLILTRTSVLYQRLYIKSEMDDVTFLDNILLTFDP